MTRSPQRTKNQLIFMLAPLVLLSAAAPCTGCVGSSGGELLELRAYAAGPADAPEAGPLVLTNSRGYRIELEQARLYVGGVYLNRARANSVASDTSCSLSGIYVAEVLAGRPIDLLSAEPQPFPAPGFATAEQAHTGEVWLSHGDVNAPDDTRPILELSGTARGGELAFPFEASFSIGSNRVAPATDAALPGAHPICKQRVVSPIPLELTPARGLALLLRIDPRGMFANVDFATLPEVEGGAPLRRFADEAGANQASDNLYSGMRRSLGVYSFEWKE